MCVRVLGWGDILCVLCVNVCVGMCCAWVGVETGRYTLWLEWDGATCVPKWNSPTNYGRELYVWHTPTTAPFVHILYTV